MDFRSIYVAQSEQEWLYQLEKARGVLELRFDKKKKKLK